jgi:hypothetical protein
MAATSPHHTPGPRLLESPERTQRSLIGLFGDLWRETSTLVRDEAELAKAEISEKISQLGAGVAEIAAGGAILFAGFIVLLFAAVGALEMLIDSEHAIWMAPLIVGLVVMIAGFIALQKGRKEMKAENLAPRRTLQSLRDDAQLAKEHVK